jgi:hypothetical protein
MQPVVVTTILVRIAALNLFLDRGILFCHFGCTTAQAGNQLLSIINDAHVESKSTRSPRPMISASPTMNYGTITYRPS